jgi:YD repeat-containing protein
MVAIVSGGMPGLNTGALNLLGGAFGNAVNGRDGGNVYVNAATGNLVVQLRDEFLASMGGNGGFVRTYNSQGQLNGVGDGDNDDGWRMGVVKTLSAIDGAINAPGSSLVRTDGDGSTAVYRYDSAAGRYMSTDGDGAHDGIVLATDGSAIWADGASGTTEHYNTEGRLISLADIDGNTTRISYDARGMVASVIQPNSDATYFDYDGVLLTQVRSVSGGVTQVRSRYGYDELGRLSQVTVDLSPEDGSIADGNVYVTRYAYDGDGTRLAGIAQSDGSSLAFTYTEAAGVYRIASVSDALGQTTSFGYDLAGRRSDVRDPTGALTTFGYDSAGQLLSVLKPAIDGVRVENTYRYDVDGNLVATVDGNGHSVGMTYDAHGNLLTQTDALGQVITRTYDVRNRLLTEAVGTQSGGAQSVSRYVHDGEGHLRFAIDGSGGVVEHRYDAAGLLLKEIRYAGLGYSPAAMSAGQAPNEAEMVSWAGAQDQAATQRLDYAYDFRGQVSSVTAYAAYDMNGIGVGEPSQTRYVYDQRGRLLAKVEPSIDHASGAIGGGAQTVYAYDALDRLLSSVDALGNRTVYQHDDALGRTVTTYANGLAAVQVYDVAGRLISVTRSDAAGDVLANTVRNRYDAAGRLVQSIDANGLTTLYLYDAAGRQNGTIDAAGRLTEWFYDGNGNGVRSVTYATAVEYPLTDAVPDLAALRPPASSQDRTTRQFYDASDRLVYVVDALGYVTRQDYDGVGNLAATVSFAQAIDVSQLANDAQLKDVQPLASQQDRTARQFHDGAGRVVGQLDAEGYLTVHRFDAAGNLVQTIRHAAPTAPGLRVDGTLEQLIPAQTAVDIRTRFYHDAQGRQVGTLDAEGYLTELTYDAAGNLAAIVRYATPANADGATLESVRPAASAADQRQAIEHDALRRVIATIDTDGTRTLAVYDNVGNQVASIRSSGSSQSATLSKQYDLEGRVRAEMSAVGSAKLNGEPVHDAAVWARYGTFYEYDAGGRLINAKSADGSQALYFYDIQGRLTHSVNAMGEVEEIAYDTFGAAVSRKVYGDSVETAGLQGGEANTLLPRLAQIANPALDIQSRIEYDARGAVLREIDALGQTSVRGYNAFGDLVSLARAVNTSASSTTTFMYDHRGLQTAQVDAAGALDLTTTAQYDAFGREILRTDAHGTPAITEYDRNGRVVVQRDRLNQQRTSAYDAFGRVLVQTDGNGNTTSYQYDDQARVVVMTTADGIRSSVRSDADGHVISIIDGNGAETRYGYDADGKLVTTVDANGNTVRNEYGAGAQLVASIDQKGVRTEYRYDAAARLLEQVVDVGGLNLSTRYSYDTRGEVIGATDPSGVLTTTSYDANGQILRTVRDPDGLGLYTQYTYDPLGRVLAVSSGGPEQAPQLALYQYDEAGRRTSTVVDPEGLNLITAYSYDKRGNVVGALDANGHLTTYTYDAENRLLSQTSAMGAITGYSYDANGNRTSTVDANGAVTTSRYDSMNRLMAQIDANGYTVAYAYDSAGNRTSMTDALGATTKYAYDAVGRLVRTEDALGHVTFYGYDAAGNRTSVGDAEGATTYVYDAANRLVGVRDRLGNTSNYMLDASGNRIATIDAAGAVIGAMFDAAGRLVSQTDALGYTTAFAYDAFGNQIGVTDANGQTSQRVYDGANRLISAIDGAGNTNNYGYDGVGNRILSNDPNGAVTDYIYDADNRLVGIGNRVTDSVVIGIGKYNEDGEEDGGEEGGGEDEGGGGWEDTRPYLMLSYVYDGVGNRIAMIDRNGGETRYSYDATGHLREVQDAGGGSTVYTYDAAGNLVSQRDSVGQTTRYSYDASGRQIGVTNALGQTQSFTYDARGNRILSIDQAGRRITFAYDREDRLTSVTDFDGNAERYEYDAVGNRTATIDRLDNVTRYTYDLAARLVRTQDNMSASEAYAYDRVGNLIATVDKNGNLSGRTYDAANRLVAVTDALGHTTAFQYDASGNTVRITDANGNVVRHTYDELNRPVYEDVEVASSYFTYDPETGTFISVPDIRIITTKTVYDGNGNVVEVIDGNRNSTRHEYDAMGRLSAVFVNSAQQSSFEYGTTGNMIRKVAYSTYSNGEEASASITSFEYDALSRLVAEVDSLGRRTLTEYDLAGNITASTDRNGQRTAYEYDIQGRRIAVIDALGGVTRNRYDALGNLLESIDRLGVSTTYEYDAGNRLVRVRDALGAATYGYDAVGNRIVQTDRLGSTTVMRYDSANRLVEARDALGNVESFGYDAMGNRTEYVNQRGYASFFAYTERGQLKTETDAHGNSISYEYDDVGNRTAVQYAGGRAERYEYDGANHLVAQFNVTGQRRVERFTYDEQGNRLTSGDEYSPTRYVYDGENRLIGVHDPLGNYTAIEVDAEGNRTAVVDANGGRTTYRYDALNRLVETVDPMGFTETATYDAEGNKLASTDRAGRITRYEYDLGHRLTALTGPDGQRTEYVLDAEGRTLSETILAGTPWARTTSSVYDSDGRLLSRSLPDGSVTRYEYDQAGNTVQQTLTDLHGQSTTTWFAYDGNNRLVTTTLEKDNASETVNQTWNEAGQLTGKTDSMGNQIAWYEYDLEGNLTSMRDATTNEAISYNEAGNIAYRYTPEEGSQSYFYDGANRLYAVQYGRGDQVYVPDFESPGNGEYRTPEVNYFYDGVGNLIESIDANGNISNFYYDANNRLISQLDGDHVLREYQYDALGNKTAERVYMDRQPDAHDASVMPVGGSNVRLYSYVYDSMGRLLRSEYPVVNVTSLDMVGGVPSSSTTSMAPIETRSYDAYGNLIELVAADGKRSVTYYDTSNRIVAQVDPMGYLTEYDYDVDGLVTAQRAYKVALDPQSISAAARPISPDGHVAVTSKVYDAAGRVVEERIGDILLSQHGVPVADIMAAAASSASAAVTTYVRDTFGNVVREISASGSPEQQTKYFFYNQYFDLMATIDARRSLTVYSGRQPRPDAYLQFGDPIDASVDLGTIGNSYEELLALVDVNSENNKGEIYQYTNSGKIQSIKSAIGEAPGGWQASAGYDWLSIGLENETAMTVWYNYDGNGNPISVEKGAYRTDTKYDALGRVIAIRQPEGTITRQEYDAVGNVVLSYTGELQASTNPVTDIRAELNNGIQLTYDMPGKGLSSYVVWDTVSHDIADNNHLGAYANQTLPLYAGDDRQGNAIISQAHGRIYYRVVTVDAAGNKVYGSEQTVAANADIDDIQLVNADNGMITMRVKLADGASAPVLRHGMYAPTGRASMMLSSDGYYEASVWPGDARWFWLAVDWTGSDGSVHSSQQSQLPQTASKFAASVQATEKLVNNGVSTALTLTLPADASARFTIVTADWRPAGSANTFATTGAQGSGTFKLTLGEGGNLRAGQSYEVILYGVNSEGNRVVLGNFLYTPTGTDGAKIATRALVLEQSTVGDARIVVINGQPVAVSESDGNLLATLPATGNSAVALYYTQQAATSHATTLDSSVWQTWVPNIDAQGTDRGQYVQNGYELGFSTVLAPDEAAQVVGGMHLSWRDSGSRTDVAFANDIIMSSSGGTYTHTLGQLALPAKALDYKIWYTDALGRQVIVDWGQARTDTDISVTGKSGTVLASEAAGSITGTTVTTGRRTGQLEDAEFMARLSLLTEETGMAGGQILINPLEQGYIRHNQYDALNHLIGTTGADGIWRAYGVDLQGNIAETTLQETERAVVQTSYAQYDQRGRVVAEYGPAFVAADGSTQRTVVRYEYDGNDRVTRTTDALGNITTSEYDALGRLISQTDALGNSKQHAYDTLGRLLSVTDEKGNVNTYGYNAAGDRIEAIDSTGVRTAWTYDGFGRVTGQFDGYGNLVKDYVYDGADRLLRAGDTYYRHLSYSGNGVSEGSEYVTDKTTMYDSMGRVTRVNLSGAISTRQYDSYGNLIRETDALGRTTQYLYGGYGRLLSVIDADGQATNYAYDSLGRKISETGGGRHIEYNYDGAGHLSQINDVATGTVTRYRYDASGRQVHESVTTAADKLGQAHGREIASTYDALGRLVHWHDSVTGMQETMTYDAVGNRVGLTGSGPNANIDHGTDFDAAGRVVALRENGMVVATYTYDAAGNRATYTAGEVMVSYTYDAHHRVLTATSSDNRFVAWEYDSDGNVTSYRETKDGKLQKKIVNTYESGQNVYNKTFWVDDEGDHVQETTNTFDASGRLTNVTMSSGDSAEIDDDSQTNFYIHTYSGDGRELHVRAYGSAKGNATFTYDVNENLVRVDQGKGDGMDRSETSSYVYDNSGKILSKYHDDGKSDIRDNLDYVYVQGNAVGQTGTSIEAGGATTVLDSGNYALFTNIDGNYPSAAATAYTVQGGDTLQSIADAAYGNRSMWYLIAEANNLLGDEELKAGQVLRIPTSSNSGPINADTHAVYNQNEIIDGTLPNLTSPSSGGGCSTLLQILVVVVAVVVATYAAGAVAGAMGSTAAAGGSAAATGTVAGSVAAGAGGATVSAGVAGGLTAGAAGAGWGTTLVAGAVGGAAGSIASQGVAIAVGLQDKFSWKNVGMGAVQGLATAGVGSYAKTSYVGADVLKNSVMARAAVTSVATQGLAVATNLQDNFSWRSVGAAALAAGVTSRVASMRTPDAIANATRGMVLSDPFAADLIRQTTAGTAGAMANQWASTGRVDTRGAVSGAFGNALGSSLADIITGPTLPISMRNLPQAQQDRIMDLARKAGPGAWNSDETYRYLKEGTDLGFSAQAQDLSSEERWRRTSNVLAVLGASQEQIEQLQANYAQSGLLKTGRLDIVPLDIPDSNGAEPIDDIANSDGRPEPFLGVRSLDTGLVGVGDVLDRFGRFVDSDPMAKLTLEGLDIISGPVMYAVRQLPVVERLTDAATSKVAGFFDEGLSKAGRSDVESSHGGIGGTAILLAGASGFAGLATGIVKFAPSGTNFVSLDRQVGALFPDKLRSPVGLNAGRGAPTYEKWINEDRMNGTVYSNLDRSVVYVRPDGVAVQYNKSVDGNAYPDFSPHLNHPSGVTQVQINEPFSRKVSNYTAANIEAGYPEWGDAPPKDYRWHHHEDGRTMQLVPKDIHTDFHHRGGVSNAKLTGPK